MANSNQVVPNYGAQPKGKANIMQQGQTQVDAWGQDPSATGMIPKEKDNPNLGATHELGSFGRKIPSRSFLRMPLSSELPHRMNAIGRDVWQAIIDKQGLRVALKKLGVHGENTVQAAFDSNGFGRWAPWSDRYARWREMLARTKKRKKRKIGPMQLAILVLTGQLAKSITSKVDGGKTP